MNRLVQPLSELSKTDMMLAGGKGANLGELLRAGFQVPPGFCITTGAYRQFVADNGLEAEIQSQIVSLNSDDHAALEIASASIRARFGTGQIPPALADEIVVAYKALAGIQEDSGKGDFLPVAVRSSATAEDLPELSFAGQQDTFLNVIGPEALLQAVVRCWSSLWTARAIGYRARNNLFASPDATAYASELALAVVVQSMVPSESAGVLFSANPLTGKRTETVIDATFGLGEALVSGLVEPDQYIVDPQAGRILKKTLGAKALSIRGQAGGGTEQLQETAHLKQALPDPANSRSGSHRVAGCCTFWRPAGY